MFSFVFHGFLLFFKWRKQIGLTDINNKNKQLVYNI